MSGAINLTARLLGKRQQTREELLGIVAESMFSWTSRSRRCGRHSTAFFRAFHVLAYGLLMLFALLRTAQADPPVPTRLPLLGADQVVWLQKHHVLRIGVPLERKPLAFKDDSGTISGSESAYATLLSRKLGVRVKLVGGTENDLERDLRRGKIDALSMQSSQTLNEKEFAFTKPYMQLTYAIFTDSSDASITDLHSLEEKRVALLDGDHYQYDLLENVENITPVPVRSVGDAVSALMTGRADAYVAPVPRVAAYLQDHLITQISAVQLLSDHPLKLSYAVRHNDDMLQSLLDAGIDAITPAEKRLIQATWLNQVLPEHSQSDQPLLTDAEKAWLKQHAGLKIAVRENWPPFEFDENGKPRGLVLDLVKKIEDRLDYQFKIVQVPDWSNVEDNLEHGKVDVIPGLTRTPSRQNRFLFSRSYLSLPIVLVIRDDSHFVGDLRELKKQRVGVVRNYASQEYLLINHPDLNIYPVESVEQGLLALSNGDLDVMVTQIPSVSYTVAKLGLSNLRITSITPYQYELRLGIRPDMPELQRILNKALASISKHEYDSIYNRWIHLDVQRDIDYTVVRRVVMVALVVIAVFLYWNRKLSREVEERIRSEDALRLSEEKLRQSMQEAEQLAREAEAANRAKSEFLANMSHEIRTPMNAVMGYAELLESSITEPRQRTYLDSIKSGSRSLLTLINDILDLSRIEAGKMRLEVGPMDVERLLEDVRRIFAMRAESRGLTLRVDIEGELPPVMLLDETRLRQVLFNLVGNAIKFTHQGSVIIRARSAPDIAAEPSSSCVLVIEVEDTGIGIPVDQQIRIFEAFEQQEGQSNRQYGGTGLGLAISRKLVEMMGGELQVQSEPGRGSLFTIRLSHVETSVTDLSDAGPDHGAHDYRFSPALILVADDNETNRRLVRDMLTPYGLRIIEAENGHQAVERARQDKPDLVLLDIRMPLMDGYECRAALHDDPDSAHIPVIALTASVMAEDSHRIRDAHFDGFLRKPVSRAEILEALSRFLPHQALHETTEEAAPGDEPPISEEQLRQLRQTLEVAFAGRWQKIKDSGDPEGIRAFGEDLQQLADETGSGPLRHYGAALCEGIDAFELDRVNRLLDDFPNLFGLS